MQHRDDPECSQSPKQFHRGRDKPAVVGKTTIQEMDADSVDPFVLQGFDDRPVQCADRPVGDPYSDGVRPVRALVEVVLVGLGMAA